ncbi:TVP38/TMEM64 family inner membrane protein YdjZ [compost metagenome]
MRKSRSIWLLLIWFSTAAVALIILKLTGKLDEMNLDSLTVWLRSLGFGGGLLYTVVYAIRPLVLFPVTPVTLYGGYVFGAFWGTVYDIIGTGAGAALSFMIARRWGRSSVERLLTHKKLQSFDDRAGKSGFMVVLYMRLLPLFPFDVVSYGAGLSKVRGWDYFIATMIGLVPGAIVYNVFGGSLQDIGSAEFYWALLMYAFFAIVPLFWMRRNKNKSQNDG